MKSDNLLLISNGYPYNNGEAFLKPELDYLSKEFDKIFILSINNKHINKRNTPNNVVIIKSNASLNNKQKFDVIRTIAFNFKLYSPLIKEEINNAKLFRNNISSTKTTSLNIASTVLHDLFIAIKKKMSIEKIMKENNLHYSNTVFYSYWLNSSATALSLLKKENKEAKVICRGHGSDIYFEMSNVGFHPFRLLNLNTLDKIFTVSEKGKKYHIEKFGNNINNIETAYLGTSSPNLKPKEPIKTDFDITIVSVSSVIPLKRVLLIPLILSKINNIRINWIHFGEGVLFDELKTTTTDLLDKKKNIEYQLMGNVSNEELINYYSENNVDLFLSLSSSEGIPVSMMEAMSFGIPVISTDVGGINELVKSNNGFLVNSSVNYDEIISIINSYNEMDSTSKKEISNKAINHWNKNFNAEENFPIFAKQLKELL